MFPGTATTVTLAQIIGICQTYKAYHQEWPSYNSTLENFELAGVKEVSGAALNAVLRNRSHGLDEDPDFMRLLPVSHQIDLSILDPEKNKILSQEGLAAIISKIDFSRTTLNASYAPVHNAMFISFPSQWRTEAIKLATGIDSDQFAASVPYAHPTIPISADLLNHIDHIGMVYGRDHDKYYIELLENNRVYMRYQSIIGSRYIGSMDPELLKTIKQHLVDGIKDWIVRDKVALPRVPDSYTPKTTIEVSGGVIGVLGDELRTLRAENDLVLLPTQVLTEYQKIKSLLLTAGGKYVSNKQAFRFPTGIDTSEVLSKLIGGDAFNPKKDFQFFATGREEAIALCEEAGISKGMRVLEPSAGDGGIADVAREMGADVVTVELWNVNAIKLREKGYEPIEKDFLTLTPTDIGFFDAIVANPPFTKNQDIDHCMHMLQFVKPGGSLSIIMSTGWQTGSVRKQTDFRAFLDSQNVEIVNIDSGAFSHAGTGVSTVRLDFKDLNIPHQRVAISTDSEQPSFRMA